MTKDHDNLTIGIHQGQAEPELEYMRLRPGNERNDTLSRARTDQHLPVSLFPIATLVAQIKISQTAPCYFNAEIVAQTRARETNAQLQRFGPDYIVEAQ